MEPTRNPSPDIRPGRSMQPGAPLQRPLQRQVFSDFTRPTSHRDPSMRPITRPVTPPQPASPQPTVSTPTHVKPAHHTPLQPTAPAHQSAPPTAPVLTTPAHAHPAAVSSALKPPTTFSDFAAPAATTVTPPQPSEPQPSLQSPSTEPVLQPPVHHATKPKHDKKEPGPKNTTGHSGLVGLISFVFFVALFFLPFLPGKVLDNFPGSSASFSTGDQALACIDTLGPVHSTVKYDTKMGFPVTYTYSTTTTQTATCKGVSQSAVGGHTSQFNPLGGLIDAVAAFALAFGIARFWRWFSGRTN